MTQVGNPSDIAGVSAERPAQAASPDAVTNGQATGEAFEAIKESLEEPSAADLIGVPAGVSNHVAAEGSMSASAAATVVMSPNAETKSDVMATGVQGETEMAAQDVQTLSAGAPSTDEALTLSMMAAGQGARVSQPLSNRPVSTVSTSTASPGATPDGYHPGRQCAWQYDSFHNKC